MCPSGCAQRPVPVALAPGPGGGLAGGTTCGDQCLLGVLCLCVLCVGVGGCVPALICPVPTWGGTVLVSAMWDAVWLPWCVKQTRNASATFYLYSLLLGIVTTSCCSSYCFPTPSFSPFAFSLLLFPPTFSLVSPSHLSPLSSFSLFPFFLLSLLLVPLLSSSHL